jgi:hypothetical protein
MTVLPNIDVVIVNYNSGHALEECLHAIYQSDNSNINLIVVDNCSTDDSLNRIQYQFNDLNVIRNKTNVGFAKACNQGANGGDSPYIAFINPDCFVSSKQLEHLTYQLKINPNAGLIGCRVLNQDGSLQAASRRRLPTFWRICFHVTKFNLLPFVTGINIKDSGKFSELKQVEAVNGACIMVNRKDFKQVGGYDEAYPLHFEDLDLFARMIKNGKQIFYDSSVEVKHIKGQSRQDSKKITSWKRQGLLRYCKKHRPYWEYKVINWMMRSK